MTLPTDLKPRLVLSPPAGERLTFWHVMSVVSRRLQTCGYPSQAQEFRQRCLGLNQNTDDDLTDLMAVVGEYVEMI